eukprot:COSAG06_NODE_1560_length_9104_cov_82.958468_1_plen_84_part_00
MRSKLGSAPATTGTGYGCGLVWQYHSAHRPTMAPDVGPAVTARKEAAARDNAKYNATAKGKATQRRKEIKKAVSTYCTDNGYG